MSDKQNNQTIPNPFDPNTLVQGLSDTNISIPTYGKVWRVTCEQLEQQVEDLYQTSLGMPELSHVLIYPEVDSRSKDVCNMRTIFYFDTQTPKSSITRNGDPNKPGVKTILDFAPSKGAAGEFSVTDKFISTMSPVAILDGNDKIPIKSVPDKRIACVEVDFFLLMALCLNIDEDQPYNFTVLTVDAGNRGNNGYENAVITILKFIDNSRRYNRNRNAGSKIDYRSMDKAFIRSSQPGGGRNY